MPTTALLDLTIKPEALGGAHAAISTVLEATRAFEGNLGVDVVVDVNDPAHILLIEHWASIEADEAYRAWRETDEGKSDLGSLLAAAPTLTIFTDAPGV
ncbi:putative quinol monooxygenase [Subtercola vilae]|uniref:ABM domain-containing protein n=1 Tax=Subtercola vilae TaxID=2056433 RepID=A0A4T2C8R1_9MICO|nr:antibiotic biosynthesis monooxygenase family protein [Subtercola vilae]TIH40600.1 hypothetical protein D4765_01030 [Subtercola vilae]